MLVSRFSPMHACLHSLPILFYLSIISRIPYILCTYTLRILFILPSPGFASSFITPTNFLQITIFIYSFSFKSPVLAAAPDMFYVLPLSTRPFIIAFYLLCILRTIPIYYFITLSHRYLYIYLHFFFETSHIY